MKKIIAWPIAWTLYWIGHAFSKVCATIILHCGPQWLNDIFWAPYQYFMKKSSDIQDWADLQSGPQIDDRILTK